MPRIHFLEPLEYDQFCMLMSRSYIILSDSGGIQEEAPSLNIPVLLLRESTERPEAVECGAVKLVGTDKVKISAELERLLNDQSYYTKMSSAANPFGDGYIQNDNPFADGYVQDSNPFAEGYVQDTNPYGEGYIQDSNPFREGYVQDKEIFEKNLR